MRAYDWLGAALLKASEGKRSPCSYGPGQAGNACRDEEGHTTDAEHAVAPKGDEESKAHREAQADSRERQEVEELRERAARAGTPKKVKDLDGNKIDPPRDFYRGVSPESSERIVTGNDYWDSLLFVSSSEKSARAYGESVSSVKAKPDAKILYEGSKAFSAVKRATPKQDDYVAYLSSLTRTAQKLGFDAVWFVRQGDIGTAIINRAKFDVAEQDAVPEGVESLITAVTELPEVAPDQAVGEFVRREHIPNEDAIDASLENWTSYGVREVPMSWFSGKPGGERALAAKIKESGEINPLIIVVDAHKDGPAYVLEGAHRFDALQTLGAKSFPALVILDEDGAAENMAERGGKLPSELQPPKKAAKPRQGEFGFLEEQRVQEEPEQLPRGYERVSKEDADEIANGIEDAFREVGADIDDLLYNRPYGFSGYDYIIDQYWDGVAEEMSMSGDYTDEEIEAAEEQSDEYIPSDLDNDVFWGEDVLGIHDTLPNGMTIQTAFITYSLAKAGLKVDEGQVRRIQKSLSRWTRGGDQAIRGAGYAVFSDAATDDSAKKAMNSAAYAELYELLTWGRLSGAHYEGTMSRGYQGDAIKSLGALEVGDEYDENSVSSWSSEDLIATVWSSNNSKSAPTLVVEMESTKDTPSLPIANLSEWPEEHEVLLAAPVRLRVKRKDVTGNITRMVVEPVAYKGKTGG